MANKKTDYSKKNRKNAGKAVRKNDKQKGWV
jgi:hypothetical protein